MTDKVVEMRRPRGKAKDYAALGAKMITRPKSLERPLKYLIYARNKRGKTTFALSGGVETTLLVDPEKGTDQMLKKNPKRWQVKQWAELEDTYRYLRTVKDHGFETASLDGLTRIHNMSMKFCLKQAEEADLDRVPGSKTQRDYGRSGELLERLVDNYFNLPMRVVFTVHERTESPERDPETEEVETSGLIQRVPNLPKGIRAHVSSLVDVIGRLYIAKVEVENPDTGETEEKPERRLWIAPHPLYDTGYRSDYVLPDYVANPTIPKLESLVRTGKLPERAARSKESV